MAAFRLPSAKRPSTVYRIKSMKKTNVLRLLDKEKIPYKTFEYNYDPDYGSAKAIAEENGISLNQVYKTLVGKGNKTGVLVAVIPSGRTLDFKALCKAAGNKKMTLVPVKELQGLTGYIRGGCSPMGMKKNYPVFLDASMEAQDLIYVNAGQRGLLVGIAPSDLRSVAKANMASLCSLSKDFE